MADKQTKAKSFVMEIADLQHDRRDITFEYGEHAEIPISYNPGAFTRAAAEREDEQDDITRRDALQDALESPKVERFLGVERGGSVAFVSDPDGLAEFLAEATVKALRKQRDAIIDTLAEGVLTAWPVAKDGEPVPITRDEMLTLPYMFLAAMYGAIMDDMSPGKNSSRGRDRARRRR